MTYIGWFSLERNWITPYSLLYLPFLTCPIINCFCFIVWFLPLFYAIPVSLKECHGQTNVGFSAPEEVQSVLNKLKPEHLPLKGNTNICSHTPGIATITRISQCSVGSLLFRERQNLVWIHFNIPCTSFFRFRDSRDWCFKIPCFYVLNLTDWGFIKCILLVGIDRSTNSWK